MRHERVLLPCWLASSVFLRNKIRPTVVCGDRDKTCLKSSTEGASVSVERTQQRADCFDASSRHEKVCRVKLFGGRMEKSACSRWL